jgi:polar amino acid transport system substrate-binding protein
MDFTIPYLTVGQVPVARSSAKPINSFGDLKGKVVGVLTGSASEAELNRQSSPNKITIKTYGDLAPMFPDLVGGKIDAFLCDDYYAVSSVKSADPNYKGKMKVAGPALTTERFGVAVKKANRTVLDLLNEGLQKVVDSVDYEAIKQKWLK